eukprot:1442805-Amphidinium_carterae.1
MRKKGSQHVPETWESIQMLNKNVLKTVLKNHAVLQHSEHFPCKNHAVLQHCEHFPWKNRVRKDKQLQSITSVWVFFRIYRQHIHIYMLGAPI